MKKFLAVLAASLFCLSFAHAQDKKAAEKASPAPAAAKPAEKAAPAPAEKKLTPQQGKMASCNKDAKEKKLAGPDRQKFMKECLSSKPVAAADEKKMTPQQGKMAKCNKDAKDKNIAGPDRKKFMSECLKG
jgi:hypothetical protein